ncbi:hypothetical protein [Aquisalibacillus elongatus]|uniref:hypothetical protein n=1 Tax=Aquisalibacillus elongatus TaxID=485577 RepID=UPI000F52F9B1|nr:hypothetical protein [Aquisalibacillus elongatus]
MYLLIKRFVSTELTLIDDWKNTNCIIHGALSINGLAALTSNLFATNVMHYFWFFVLGLLVAVGGLEVLRAYKRVKTHGFKRGIWVYHTSQWSRNFTFGMFFAFSLALTVNSNYNLPTWLTQFEHWMLSFWAYVVLISLLVEIWLFVDHKLKSEHVAY